MHLPVVVWRLLGEVMSWLLGSSSLWFSILGTHLPETPDLSGPFPTASLWDDRCCVLYPACISGLPLWSSGGGVSGKGCNFQCLIGHLCIHSCCNTVGHLYIHSCCKTIGHLCIHSQACNTIDHTLLWFAM